LFCCTKEDQKELDAKGRRHETTSHKDAKARRCLRETSQRKEVGA